MSPFKYKEIVFKKHGDGCVKATNCSLPKGIKYILVYLSLNPENANEKFTADIQASHIGFCTLADSAFCVGRTPQIAIQKAFTILKLKLTRRRKILIASVHDIDILIEGL